MNKCVFYDISTTKSFSTCVFAEVSEGNSVYGAYRTTTRRGWRELSVSLRSLTLHENHFLLFTFPLVSSTPARTECGHVVVCRMSCSLYAGCQPAVELISGLPLRLADPIRLWKLGWLDWHTPSNPASNHRLWPHTGVWLVRTPQSRPAPASLHNPNIDRRGFLSHCLSRYMFTRFRSISRRSQRLFFTVVAEELSMKVWILFFKNICNWVPREIIQMVQTSVHTDK